jgi:hypothetical protein
MESFEYPFNFNLTKFNEKYYICENIKLINFIYTVIKYNVYVDISSLKFLSGDIYDDILSLILSFCNEITKDDYAEFKSKYKNYLSDINNGEEKLRFIDDFIFESHLKSNIRIELSSGWGYFFAYVDGKCHTVGYLLFGEKVCAIEWLNGLSYEGDIVEKKIILRWHAS